MKNWIFLLFSVFALTACDPIEGTLQVVEKTSLNLEDDKVAHLNPGTYSAKLTFAAKDELELSVKDAFDLDIKLPEGTVIPDRRGSLDIKGEQIGQPWDVHAEIDTAIDQSRTRHDWEFCTYTRVEWVCDRNGRCRRVVRTYQGRRDVEFYFETTTKMVKLNLINTSEASSVFDGQRVTRKRIYTWRGRCF